MKQKVSKNLTVIKTKRTRKTSCPTFACKSVYTKKELKSLNEKAVAKKVAKLEPSFNLFDYAKPAILRVTVFALIVALNWTGISTIAQTASYFNDTEASD